jgi:ActR/RegA family two-component response regulator
MTQPQLSKESASQIAIEYLKKRKNTEKVEVALVEAQDDCWVIHGTCPIEFGEMQWPEKFAVVVDSKGKIKSTDYGLL